MDPFSDVIALLRPTAAVAKPISGRGRWGVRYEAHDAPGFALVLQGECWLSFKAGAPAPLHQGDFLLLPSTPAFTLSSHPGIGGEPTRSSATAVRHGEQDGEPEFVALGGTFGIERANAALMLALLPSVIHIPASEGRTDRLHRIIALIGEECAHREPGRELLLRRLLEVLLVEALRWRGAEGAAAPAGLLRGLRDPALARALRAMHADVRAGWTVAGLAKVAGMSRSAFAARFGEMLGCGPIEYLARWRMALAKEALIRGAKTLDHIANEVGYGSASAFSTAFRKRLGAPPGRFSRQGAAS